MKQPVLQPDTVVKGTGVSIENVTTVPHICPLTYLLH